MNRKKKGLGAILVCFIIIFMLFFGIKPAHAATCNRKKAKSLLDSTLNHENRAMGVNPVSNTKLITDAIIQPSNQLSGLHLKFQDANSISDECGIYFSKTDSDNYNTHDALDVDGITPKVYLSSYTTDNARTCVNSMGDYIKGKRIKLFVKATTDGLYHISLEDVNNIDTALVSLYLVDKFKNDSLNIVQHKSYAFNIVTADTNSFGSNRFMLVVERKPLPPYQLISFTAQKAAGGVQVNWKTYNEGNYTGFVLQKQSGNNQFTALDSLQGNGSADYNYIDHDLVTGSNVYRLQQHDINGKITYSVPVTIIYNNASVQNAFSIYPNPSREIITISVSDIKPQTTNYISNIYNNAGKLIGQRSVSSNSWTEDITTFKPGIYFIVLKGNDGSLIGRSKFIKTN